MIYFVSEKKIGRQSKMSESKKKSGCVETENDICKLPSLPNPQTVSRSKFK